MEIIERIAIFSSKLTIHYIYREENRALNNDRLLDLKNLFKKIYLSKGLENGWQDYHNIKVKSGAFPDIIITDITLLDDAISTFKKIFIENSNQVVISISKFSTKEELNNYINLGISYMLLEPVELIQFNSVIERASEAIYHRKWERKRRKEINEQVEILKKELIEIKKSKDNILLLLINNLWKDSIDMTTDNSLEGLSLINYEDGLKRMGGDEDLYKELLTGFCSYYVNSVKDIKKAFIKKNFEEIAVLAHSVKGAAGNISAKPIYDNVIELENAIKSGKDDIEIFILILKFEKAFNTLCSSLHKIIGE